MRLLLQIVSQLVLAAIALIVVHFAVPGVTLHLGGFFVALGVFALAQAVFSPLVMKLAQRYAAPLAGGVGLVSTMLALWVATLFQGGIEITQVSAWFLAPIIIWVITALGGWIFMEGFVKRRLKERDAERTVARSRR